MNRSKEGLSPQDFEAISKAWDARNGKPRFIIAAASQGRKAVFFGEPPTNERIKIGVEIVSAVTSGSSPLVSEKSSPQQKK